MALNIPQIPEGFILLRKSTTSGFTSSILSETSIVVNPKTIRLGMEVFKYFLPPEQEDKYVVKLSMFYNSEDKSLFVIQDDTGYSYRIAQFAGNSKKPTLNVMPKSFKENGVPVGEYKRDPENFNLFHHVVAPGQASIAEIKAAKGIEDYSGYPTDESISNHDIVMWSFDVKIGKKKAAGGIATGKVLQIYNDTRSSAPVANVKPLSQNYLTAFTKKQNVAIKLSNLTLRKKAKENV